MCNTTLWGVRVTIVAVEIQQYVPFVLLLTYTAAVINIKRPLLSWKCNNGCPLLCCRASFRTAVNNINFVI